MRGNRSVDASRFSMVPRSDIPRSAFDVVHGHKTTFRGGLLVPLYVDLDVLPGDQRRVNMTAFCRLATPIVPIMDNLYLESFFFFVPYRLVWENWSRFMGEQDSPTDTTDFMVPQVAVTASVPNTIQDFMGITFGGAYSADINVSALPFRAYHLIWNEFFRDQDLQNPQPVSTSDGPDAIATYGVLRRNKRHDYFTSARPWPQKPLHTGQTTSMQGPYTPGGNMLFPQAGAPVTGIGVATGSTSTAGAITTLQSGGRTTDVSPYYSSGTSSILVDAMGGNFPDIRVLINDIRTAAAVQAMMERNSRSGTRYAEIVQAHFGVTSPDARLQRPEYLGGGRSMVTVNPVAQTSATAAAGSTTPLGELGGIGTVLANHGFTASFVEHGCIIGLVNVRGDLSYQQGINRSWFRRTHFDFYWPGLANLGEQAILSQELFATGDAADKTVFGYQERWSEYKYKPSRISGAFRSTVASPLDVWHLGQEFSSRPVLNEAFIQEDPPLDRVLQTDAVWADHFLCDAMFFERMVRPMPMYSIPGLGPRL